MKRTIVEAIRQVMQTAARPMTVQEVYDAITAANLYTFVLSIFVGLVQVLSTWLFAMAGGGRKQLVRQHVGLAVGSLLALPIAEWKSVDITSSSLRPDIRFVG